MLGHSIHCEDDRGKKIDGGMSMNARFGSDNEPHSLDIYTPGLDGMDDRRTPILLQVSIYASPSQVVGEGIKADRPAGRPSLSHVYMAGRIEGSSTCARLLPPWIGICPRIRAPPRMIEE